MALQQYAAMRSPACYLIVVASIKGPLKLGFEAALVGFPYKYVLERFPSTK